MAPLTGAADAPPQAARPAGLVRSEPASIALRITAAAVAFRLLSALVAFIAHVVFPSYRPDQFTVFGRPSPFWDTFARYDSGWYYQIARYGYTAGPVHFVPGGRSSIAFFPLYPLLMRYVAQLLGPNPANFYLAGIIVSWIAFALAMVMLYKLARLDLPRHRAERAVLYAAIFPFAFFYGVVYSESVFLLFTVSSFYFFRTRRWALGGMCGALATATRVTGIMMLPPLAWIAWRSARPERRDRIAALAAVAFVTAGIGAYSFYIYRLSGNPFEWAATITRWGYYPGGMPWVAPLRLVRTLATHPYTYLTTDRLAPYDTLNGLSAIFFIAATPFVWRRLGAGYALFIIANLWLPLSSGVFEGVGRYCAVLFPCFIWLATVRSRIVSGAVIVLFAVCYTLCLALFTNIHPLF